MKKTHTTVLSSLVLSGAVLVMAPQAWSQTGGSSGTASSQSGSQKSDPSASGSSSQRGTSSDMQTQRDSGTSAQSSARSGSGQRMSKDKVKEVQAALKNKGMDPGPEDGVLGPGSFQPKEETTDA